LRDAKEGMSDADRDALIARELDKGGKMDADLVEEALKDARQPSFDMAANWASIEQKLDQRGRAASPIRRRARWAQAAAVVLAVLLLVSIGTAVTNAGRWDSLIRVFRPVANTLGIYLNVSDLSGVGQVEKREQAQPDVAEESVSRTIRDERDVPGAVQGIAAKPSWLPEGYAFFAAEEFKDYNESSLTITYQKGASELFVQTVVYAGDETLTAVNVLEKGDKEAQTARGITITENEGIVNAVRENGRTLHMVWGRLSREEITRVIDSIRGSG
jgi:hypothetical protein